MSGGKYNYVYRTLLEECEGKMFDGELEKLLKDFADVLHDLELWQSGDIGEVDYRARVVEFKSKYIKKQRN